MSADSLLETAGRNLRQTLRQLAPRRAVGVLSRMLPGVQFELDHIFCVCRPGAPEMEALVEAGLVEGTPNVHPGQGTANRRIFFDNAYIELLFLVNEAEARAPLIQRTGLLERCLRLPGTCPFGICVRPVAPGGGELFDDWDYRPPYLPAGMSIAMSTESEDSSLPLLFAISGARRPPDRTHPLGLREIKNIRLIMPDNLKPSRSLSWLVDHRLIEATCGAGWQMEILFAEGGSVDLRPHLPITIGTRKII